MALVFRSVTLVGVHNLTNTIPIGQRVKPISFVPADGEEEMKLGKPAGYQSYAITFINDSKTLLLAQENVWIAMMVSRTPGTLVDDFESGMTNTVLDTMVKSTRRPGADPRFISFWSMTFKRLR